MRRKYIAMLALATGLCLGGFIAVLGQIPCCLAVEYLTSPNTAEAASKIKIDTKHFPGKIFREYVKAFDTNKDGYLSEKERKAVKRIELDNGKFTSHDPISKAPIVDLKGLEYFPQTEELWVSCYRLKNMKFEKLKKLKMVQFARCKKVDRTKSDETYDFTKNKKLRKVDLHSIGNTVKKILFAKDNEIERLLLTVPEQMDTVDLSRLSQVEYLEISGYKSKVESIDLSQCVSLREVWISGLTKLTRLDCSNCTDLRELQINDSHLASLDISKNKKLERLDVSSNYFSKLDVSQNTELYNLNCSKNFLETLDIAMLKKLRYLDCRGLGLKELNLKGNPELESVSCQVNCLEALDVSENKKLSGIHCDANPLEELDVSMLPELEYLDCEYGRLTSLDISKNGKLKRLFFRGNRISAIDLAGRSLEETNESQIEFMQNRQLLPPADSVPEAGIPIDKEHFPDYALRYEVLADFDTNRDGILSETESLAKQPLKLKKFYADCRREIDCTGMEYLKGITEVKFGKNTTLLNNTFQK